MSEKVSVVLTLDDKDFSIRIKGARESLGQLDTGLSRTSNKLKVTERSIGSLTSKVRDMVVVIALAKDAFHNIGSAAFGWQNSILQASANIERLTVMMEGMSNAATDAERKLDAAADTKFLTEFSKNAPFQLQALTDSFVKLKSVGIDPTQGSLEAITNAVARFGGDATLLHRASIAIQQMSGKGVISMEELRQQLGEAVPNAMSLMAVSMRMTMSELADIVSQGRVESGAALDKMLAQFELTMDGANERMMMTMIGMTQSLESRWQLFLNNIGQAKPEGGDDALSYLDSYKLILGDLIEMLDDGRVIYMGQQFGQSMAQVAQSVREAVATLWEYREAIKTAAIVLASFWAVTKGVSAMRTMGQVIMSVRTNVISAGAAMANLGTAVSTMGYAFDRNASSAARASNAIGALRLSAVALRGVLATLSGPVGIVVTAITTLAMTFETGAEKIDNAVQTLLASKGAMADAEKIDDVQTGLGKTRARIAEVQRQIEKFERGESITNALERNLQGISDASKYADLKKELYELNRTALAQEKALSLGREALAEREHNMAISRVDRLYTLRSASIQNEYNMELDRIAELNQLKEAAKDEEKTRLDEEIRQRQLDAIDRNYDQRVALLESMIAEKRDELNKASTEVARSAIQLTVNHLREKIADLEQSRQRLIDTFDKASGDGILNFGRSGESNLDKMISKLQVYSKELEKMRQRQEDGSGGYLASAEADIRRIEMMTDFSQVAREEFEKLANEIRGVARAMDQIAIDKKTEQADKKADELMRKINAFVAETAAIDASAKEKALVAHNERIAQMQAEIDIRHLSAEKQKQIQDAFERYVTASNNRMAYESRDAVQVLADEWSKSMEKMDEVFANTFKGAADELTNFVMTGKADFASLIDSMISDLIRLMIQQQIMAPLMQMFGLGGISFGGASAGASAGGTVNLSSLDSMGSGWSATPFAMGGIMTGKGPLDLHAYANGGIASSPQLALFGEGSMNEAFVPLPDGRTIPVTMKGGMAPEVHLNIINNSGEPVDAKQGQPKFDGKKFVLDVVLEAVNRPGSFRNGMKGALR